MNIDRVGTGDTLPEEFNVIIEIPSCGAPVKYEVDKETGSMMVDRFLNTAMYYPCNYGYVPHTLGQDGDPVDVLVITPVPLITGAVVKCRTLGMLAMTDESGSDAKLLAVPTNDLCTVYEHCRTADDLPRDLLDRVAHFFEHYKDLESNKWVRLEGWESPEQAKKELMESVTRFKAAPVKPHF